MCRKKIYNFENMEKGDSFNISKWKLATVRNVASLRRVKIDVFKLNQEEYKITKI